MNIYGRKEGYCAECGAKTDGTRLCDLCNQGVPMYDISREMRGQTWRNWGPSKYGYCTRCGMALPEDGRCGCWDRD